MATTFLIVNGLHLDLAGLDGDDPERVAAECREQLEIFRALLGRNPTHLDSHHDVHESEPAKGAAEALAGDLGVPLRNRAIRYEGPVPTSSYDAERRIELETLRDPAVKDLLNVTHVRLCSFAQAKPA